MTLYYSMCFGLLMSEIALFSAIIAPMPFTLRKRMFHFLSENPIVAKVQYALKITFIFVAVLFIDALQRMVRIAQEGAYAKQKQEMADVRAETTYAARRFYAQRNLYLTGATLFLSLILSRVFYIILDFIHTQEELNALTGKDSKGGKATGASETEQLRARVKELEAENKALQAKDRDFDNLKKQASQQANEYNRLADEHNKATGSVSDKKAD
ncbi:Endoplasmic reticulum transmembrane protein 3 [Vanrija albida]|uniref:Endoplasmic reticulum transmembrane protein n=1 Tax=Vanrija albida TaxID=181172 RepID=A0ABR3QEU1_9TREE